MSRARVLVIDDESYFARAVARILGAGVETVLAESGEAALALLMSGSKFDVIVCDVHMDGLSGPDLRDRLSELAPQWVSRMVFMTGHRGSATSRRVTDHLLFEKPLDAASFKKLIEARIESARGEDQSRPCPRSDES